MNYVDRHYIDVNGELHFLSAADQENAIASGLDLPKVDWKVVTDDQVAVVRTSKLWDNSTMARVVRDGIRSQIDLLLRPAATVKGVLITDDEKTSLIADSVLLANWPEQSNWPEVSLPVLSSVAQKYLTIPKWPE